jgi:hypothetical protein
VAFGEAFFWLALRVKLYANAPRVTVLSAGRYRDSCQEKRLPTRWRLLSPCANHPSRRSSLTWEKTSLIWFPLYMRHLAEQPANVMFVLRNLFAT